MGHTAACQTCQQDGQQLPAGLLQQDRTGPQCPQPTLGAGITHWQSPYFFGYFPCNSSFPALLGDMLCSGLATQNFSWIGSPAATELETVSG